MTQSSDFPYQLSDGLKSLLAESGRQRKAAEKTFKPAKRRAPRHAGWTRKQIAADALRRSYLEPKKYEKMSGWQSPALPTHKGASTPMHRAVSGLAWKAHDRFAQICRMEGSDFVLGKMAVVLAPVFDADALAYLAQFDDRAAQIPGHVKRALSSAMIGKSAFKAHHARVDAARGRVVKRIVWWFINEAIRTPANAPLTGETGTIATSNKMGFVADDLFAVLLPEFKKVWAKKNGKPTADNQSAKGRPGKPQREKSHKPGRGTKSQKARADLVKQVYDHLQAGD